jgi:HAD superfamily hydrolase (TIGR01509 family)
MDGLMLDTERSAVDCWMDIARERGWKVDRETGLKTVGVDEKTTRRIIQADCGPDFPYEEIRSALVRRLTADFKKNGVPHRPGLAPLLNHLDSLGIPLGVATSTERRLALWKLRYAGIRRRFSVIVCGNEVERGKPAPDIYLLAAERLGTTPARCVGFEDSPAGLQALHHAGIPAVFVKDLIEPSPDILATVWRRCETLEEAIPLFS